MSAQPKPGRPWGLTRMAPYQMAATTAPFRMEVDPATQIGVYYDHHGEVLPAFESSAGGKHGSLDQTQQTKTTGGTRDGAEDSDTHTDQDRD